MRPSNNLDNKTPSDFYWSVQLVYMKVQAHSFLEPPMEYNKDQGLLISQGSLRPFQTVWELQKYYAVQSSSRRGNR